jgi:hypothetical protein
MELCNEMIVDAREDIREIGLRIEDRHLCRFDERHRVGDIVAADIGADE